MNHSSPQEKSNPTHRPRNGLFIFHRDLRILDNVGLTAASKDCDRLYTAFIFTPEQVSGANHYKSKNAVQFMIESLIDLAENIGKKGGDLITLYGDKTKILVNLIQTLKIDALYFNRDYTPYARERDEGVVKLCERAEIECKMFDDYYLCVPGSIKNGQGGFYHKFTPFYETVIDTLSKHAMSSPSLTYPKNLTASSSSAIPHRIKLADALPIFVGKVNENLVVRGGRANALVQLRGAIGSHAHYADTRDIMANETTQMSAAIKFGCISIREIYNGFRKKYNIHHELIRQLIWRDFFAHLLYGYPETLTKMYSPKFGRIHWKTKGDWLDQWKTGNTGFPLVDAAMRQLNQTGYMHNRGRMVVANFLVKTLTLDWREGERHFAQHLTDYDVASNSGNWQSIVGGGVYASAWFRDMNPWIQSAKYDKDARYIKRWVPELADVIPRDIHRWNVACLDAKYKTVDYAHPIVDYSKQKEHFFALYRKYVS